MKLGKFIEKYCKDHKFRLLHEHGDSHVTMHSDYNKTVTLGEIREWNKDLLNREVIRLVSLGSFDSNFDHRALNIVIKRK